MVNLIHVPKYFPRSDLNCARSYLQLFLTCDLSKLYCSLRLSSYTVSPCLGITNFANRNLNNTIIELNLIFKGPLLLQVSNIHLHIIHTYIIKFSRSWLSVDYKYYKEIIVHLKKTNMAIIIDKYLPNRSHDTQHEYLPNISFYVRDFNIIIFQVHKWEITII